MQLVQPTVDPDLNDFILLQLRNPLESLLDLAGQVFYTRALGNLDTFRLACMDLSRRTLDRSFSAKELKVVHSLNAFVSDLQLGVDWPQESAGGWWSTIRGASKPARSEIKPDSALSCLWECLSRYFCSCSLSDTDQFEAQKSLLAHLKANGTGNIARIARENIFKILYTSVTDTTASYLQEFFRFLIEQGEQALLLRMTTPAATLLLIQVLEAELQPGKTSLHDFLRELYRRFFSTRSLLEKATLVFLNTHLTRTFQPYTLSFILTQLEEIAVRQKAGYVKSAILRLRQASALPFEMTGLKQEEMVRILLAAEYERAALLQSLKQVGMNYRLPAQYFKKRDLPRSYAIDFSIGLFILSKEKVTLLCEKGGCKKVTSAIFFPHEVSSSARVISQGVNLYRKGHAVYEMLVAECRTAGQLGNLPCMVKKIADLFYAKEVDGQVFPMAALFMDYFPQNLDTYLMANPLDRTNDRLIVDQIMTAVSNLHKEGIVHGDLKLQNVLVDYRAAPIRLGLGDYGHVLPIAQVRSRGVFLQGCYGSLLYTAPEILEVDGPFTGDVIRAELWALGVLLYYIRFRDYPNWLEELKAYQNDLPNTQKREALHTQIGKILDALSKQIEKEQDPHVKFIYSLLSKEPQKRPLIHDVRC